MRSIEPYFALSDEHVVGLFMFFVIHRRAGLDRSGMMFGHKYRLPEMPLRCLISL